jgi:Tfp pilus assembly protein PilF
MAQSAPHYDKVSHLLSQIGLLALCTGQDEDAERIFRRQRKVLADPASLEVARAMVMLQAGRTQDAMSVLADAVLAAEPTHAAANAVYGLALRTAGLPGERECFETVLAVSLDPALRNLALAELSRS